MPDTATLQANLAEAETALHALMTGTSVAEATYDGKTVKYRATQIAELRAYVAELKSQLGTGGRAPSRGVVMG